MIGRCSSDGQAQYGTIGLFLGLFACLYLSFGGRSPPPIGLGPFCISLGGGGLVLFRVFCGGGRGTVSLIGVYCVLCFLDPVIVVYVHSVLPWKILRCGGDCV